MIKIIFCCGLKSSAAIQNIQQEHNNNHTAMHNKTTWKTEQLNCSILQIAKQNNH